jgi:moderate conductance mechanosensitive channel
MDRLRELLDVPGAELALAVVVALIAVVVLGRVSRWIVRLKLRPPPMPRFAGRDHGDVDFRDTRREERFVRRIATLERFTTRALTTVAIVAVLAYTLSLLNVQLFGLVAGAGIVGIAIAFGSQTLVRDALSGIFLLIESPYDIGDYVRLNAVEGEVVAISLRRTTLLGDDGAEHTVPNGSITQTTNFTRHLIRHSVVLRVASDVPYERVVAVVSSVAQTLAGAPEVADSILDGPSVRGIVAFRSDSYDVEVHTGVHRDVRRTWPGLLARQLMRAFGEAEIRVL